MDLTSIIPRGCADYHLRRPSVLSGAVRLMVPDLRSGHLAFSTTNPVERIDRAEFDSDAIGTGNMF